MTTTMTPETMTVEELRREGLRLYYANALEEALPYFDRALSIVDDPESRDLLTVNKASIHVALEQTTPEVQALPSIIMRRPALRGLAAYHLATKFENERDYARARFYLEISLAEGRERGDHRLAVVTTIDLGNLCVYDSKTDDAVAFYEAALEQLSNEELTATADPNELTLWRALAIRNMGYCGIITDQPADGVAQLLEAMELLARCGGDGHLTEAHLDLCLGYLELGQLDDARTHGEIGLRDATEARQVRNGHYLLGEIAFMQGDSAGAEAHFSALGSFYPDFPQLQNLLLAIDLRKMVNFKL